MKRIIIVAIAMGCGALAPTASGQIVVQNPHYQPWKPTDPRIKELAVVHQEMRSTPAWRAAVLQRMLARANRVADRLHLPTPHPIQARDIVREMLPPPLAGLIINPWGDNLYNAAIPRQTRLRALGLGVGAGVIDTTNFDFGFVAGRLTHLQRLEGPMNERRDQLLDQLVGKPSLINDAQAHELAVQWLAAIDVDMTKLAKLKWTVHQLRYQPLGVTNVVVLPIYHVRFGNVHYPADGNMPAFDEPQAEVDILGTTKEPLGIRINTDALSLLRQPLLLIPNALKLINTTNPPLKQLRQPPTVQTNSPSP